MKIKTTNIDRRSNARTDAFTKLAAGSGLSEVLIKNGRTNIATIASPQDMPPGIDRISGWQLATAEAGLDDSPVEYGDFTLASGARVMRRLLGSGKPLDGLFVANDQVAAVAYTVLQERGLRIPGNVAVVASTTIRLPRRSTPS